MNHDDMHHDKNHKSESIYKSFTANVWVSIAVIVGIILFYLLTHHKKHVFDVLPYMLITAMMLMHIFMHGGHGGHGQKGGHHG